MNAATKISTIFIATVFFLTGIIACSGNKAIAPPVALTPAEAPAMPKNLPYIIQPNDQLDIKFFYNPELNETVLVRPDGKISLQLVDEIQAAGVSPSALDRLLTEKYSKELKKPMVTVIVRTFAAQRIYVGGEVTTQGLVTLPAGMTALQAVVESGGFLPTAKPEETIVIRKGPDNKPIPIRIDLASAMQGQSDTANFLLQPSDIVYVPKSAIAKANLFVDQYIQQLLLFRGFSFGFTHELDSLRPSRW